MSARPLASIRPGGPIIHAPTTIRPARALVAVAALAAVLAVIPAGPAGAADPVPARGAVHAGIYPGSIDLDGVEHNGPLDNAFFDDQVLGTFAVDGKRVTFAGRFHTVTESDSQPDAFNTIQPMEYAWKAQATPFVNVTVNGASAASVASGAHDAAIRRWAGHVKTWLDMGEGRSLVIAPLQEMNGSWTPWGCEPGSYPAAYRKFVDIFRSMGMNETQVRWSFAPNGWTSHGCGGIASYYPGDAYVDVVGISAYNFSGVSGSPWSTPYQALIDPINEVRALAPTKPVIIAQTASPSFGGDKNQWVRDLFAFTANDANIVGFVWFNINKWEGSPAKFVDWVVAAGGSAGWRDGMRQPTTTYEWPLASWFQPGPLTVGAAAPGGSSADSLCADGAQCDSVGLIDAGAQFSLWRGTSDGAGQDAFYFGNPGDYPLMGDWDCDGTKTPGQYRQSDGYVYRRNSNDSGVGEIRFFFGDPGDVPLVGDFNGDGCDTVSIYRPDQGRIFIVNQLGENDQGLGAAETDYFFGNPGDKPFVGDFDGDGRDTVGLHRETTGLVYFNNEHRSQAADSQFIFGDPGDRIVAGDWDGDGTDSPALYRPSNGMVYLKLTNTAGVADGQFYAGPGFTAAVLAPHV